MKKNSIKVALIAVFCLALGFTAYNAQNENENLSDVMLANMEALAQNETGSRWYLTKVTQTSHTCVWGGYFSCL